MPFPELVAELYRSLADHSERQILRKYAAYDCLLIDEVGYAEVEPAQVGLFFILMRNRHKTKTTLITSNLGFREWGSFLKSPQLTGALLDRLTETSYVFNIKNGCSLRPPLDQHEAGRRPPLPQGRGPLRLPVRDERQLDRVRRYLNQRRGLADARLEGLIQSGIAPTPR